jgi:hypothetical protein
MGKKRCSLCSRPVTGHDGPTGARCRQGTVTPLKIPLVDTSYRKKLGAGAEGDLKGTPLQTKKGEVLEFSSSEDYATGSGSEKETTEDVVKRVVHKKLRKFGSKIDKLTSTVECLVKRDLKAVRIAVPDPVVEAPVSNQAKKVNLGASTSASSSAGIAESSKQTTSSLAKNTEVNALLSKYSESEREFLEVQEAINKDSLTSGEKNKKFLAIVDFVTLPECFLSDDEETLLTTTGRQLTFKSKNKKLEPKEVSAAQWIGANSRILDVLYPTLSKAEISDYNDYTRQIGDLLQLYTEPSVMSLDHSHRKAVAMFNRRWNDVSNHTERFYLRVKPSQKADRSDSVKGTKPKGRSKFQHVCVKYNTSEGCTYGDQCRFRHKCNEKGCHDTRPKHTHEHFRAAGS